MPDFTKSLPKSVGLMPIVVKVEDQKRDYNESLGGYEP
jgi:hypothetical protein